MVNEKEVKKYKVLAIAEAANPTWTSVPLVGWSLANSLQSVADVHLVTQIRNKQAILDAGYTENEDFTAIDSELVMRPLWRLSSLLRGGEGKGWTTASAISSIGYYYFEYLVWRKFKDQIINGNFDIIHRITPLSPTIPSLLAQKCKDAGVPFVLGPLNGGVPWPKGFNKARRQEKEWLSYVRGAYRYLPGYKSTLKASAAILTGSKYTLSQIPEIFHNKCIYIPENAIDPNKFHRQKTNNKNEKLRACFVGRLVPYKGPDMLIEAALPFLHDNKMTIDIIGDGPLMPVLQETIKTEQIEKQVTLHGWVNHSSLQSIMCESRVLAFPSIREFGGGVVLEAMALGIIPIVVNYAGPGELVNSQVGFKVPIGSREEIITSFKSVFKEIIKKEYDLDALAETSVKRVNDLFTWHAKAEQIARVYQWVLEVNESKPNFF